MVVLGHTYTTSIFVFAGPCFQVTCFTVQVTCFTSTKVQILTPDEGHGKFDVANLTSQI